MEDGVFLPWPIRPSDLSRDIGVVALSGDNKLNPDWVWSARWLFARGPSSPTKHKVPAVICGREVFEYVRWLKANSFDRWAIRLTDAEGPATEIVRTQVQRAHHWNGLIGRWDGRWEWTEGVTDKNRGSLLAKLGAASKIEAAKKDLCFHVQFYWSSDGLVPSSGWDISSSDPAPEDFPSNVEAIAVFSRVQLTDDRSGTLLKKAKEQVGNDGNWDLLKGRFRIFSRRSLRRYLWNFGAPVEVDSYGTRYIMGRDTFSALAIEGLVESAGHGPTLSVESAGHGPTHQPNRHRLLDMMWQMAKKRQNVESAEDILAMPGSNTPVGHLPNTSSRRAALLLAEIVKTARNEKRFVIVARNAIHTRAGLDLTDYYVQLGFEKLDRSDGSYDLVLF
jgi:hypothetical protein